MAHLIDEAFQNKNYPLMKGKVYLDHAGTTVPAKLLYEKYFEKLNLNLYGNPHSLNDPAIETGLMVEKTREAALQFFRADPEHFDLIFTQNATAAIKIVGESFRDLSLVTPSRSFWFGYHKDSHTSLVGIRELCNSLHHCFHSDQEVEDWLTGSMYSANKEQTPGLFAYPGQSNMTGRRLPLNWLRKLRHSSAKHLQDVYTLLDAASLAATAQIDLSDVDSAPDFMAVSFYKIFGFPDLGALIVRKKSGHILSWRKYFGGGTVDRLTVMHEPFVMRKSDHLHEALEDGTLPFHNILALGCAFEVHEQLYGSMEAISQHTMSLAKHMFEGLSNLRHPSGHPICVIYNDNVDTAPYTDPITQGAIIAFNIYNADGTIIPCDLVEKLANERRIFLRSGGLCNPGGIATYLKIEPWQFMRAWSAGHRCSSLENSYYIINGTAHGVLRASLGGMSTLVCGKPYKPFSKILTVMQAEVDALVNFLKTSF